MKRLISIILACLFLCGFAFLPAEAENAEDEVRKLDQTLARWGLTMTVQLMGNACDKLDSIEPDPLKAYYKSFSEIDYLRPYKVLVIDLTTEQAEMACKVLNAENTVDIAPALAAYLNKDYPEYSKAVEQVLPEVASTSSEACTLVLLTYQRHIAAVSFDGYCARSALIISMESSSRNLNVGDIGIYAGQIGLTNLNIRIYTDQDMNDLLELDSWQASYYGVSGALVGTLTKSGKRLQRLFPLTLKENTLNDEFRFYILQSYLQDAMTEDLCGAAKLVSRTLLPMITQTDPNAVNAFMDACKKMIDISRDDRRPPEISYSDGETTPNPEGTYSDGETTPNPEGTYVFVIELHNPERDTESFLDPVLEAALPEKNIPETPEAADYIIRCKVTYSEEPDLSNSSASIYEPTTYITIHDAHTGDLICNLGSVIRPLPKGVVMALKGNTYHYPYLDQIWEKVQTIFDVSSITE